MNRRRNLLGISRGIIKDGLILYLDGIQNKKAGHDFKVNTWEDLSGNDTSVLFENAVAYDGDGYLINSAESPSYVYNDTLSWGNDYSFECLLSCADDSSNGVQDFFGCYSPVTADCQIWAISGSEQGICFRLNGSSSRFPSGTSTYLMSTHQDFYITVVRSRETGFMTYYVNGSKVFNASIGARNYTGFTLGQSLARKHNGSVKWKMFRFYNKPLTEDEIQQNFGFDKQRYRF